MNVEVELDSRKALIPTRIIANSADKMSITVLLFLAILASLLSL
jgi:hypothetical protein